MSITRVSSTSRCAHTIGSSSAVAAGNLIVLSGVSALSADGDVVGGNDPYAQMRACLAKAVSALSEVGASTSDVIQTRTYLTDPAHRSVVCRAHREVFEHARPAATMVVVTLLDPRMLVEIEVMAYAEPGAG
jgi:enamine deaminase RidA (YjgF/YER057c/UK114 family)